MERDKKQKTLLHVKLQYQMVLSVSCKKQIYPKLLPKINEVRDVQQWSRGGAGEVMQKERDLVAVPLFYLLPSAFEFPSSAAHPSTKALLTIRSNKNIMLNVLLPLHPLPQALHEPEHNPSTNHSEQHIWWMAGMRKAGGAGMVPLLYQCPSTLLKHTHPTDPSIKHFHSGTLKDVFLFLKRLFNASEAGLRCRKKGRRMEEREEVKKDI